MPGEELEKEPEPLKIKCSSTDCENNQHYFGAENKRGKRKKTLAHDKQPTLVFEEDAEYNAGEALSGHKPGCCCKCGANRVDWERLHQRDIKDVDYTITSLSYGCWQHDWLSKNIDQKAINYARRKGYAGTQMAAEQVLRQKKLRQGVVEGEPRFDTWQTAKKDNPICYAQHAMACCCRNCIELWHGIPRDRDLTNDDIAYLTDLIMVYIKKRLPNLTDFGEKVPAIRKQQSKKEVFQ